MSFLPVTEALLRLEIEGLLESRPRAGTRVRIPTEEDVRGHYAVRAALEVQAARFFAERAEPDEISELSRLAARVDLLGQAPGSDRVVYLTLHERLHGRIAQAARCPALGEAIEKTHALASTWLCVGQRTNDNEPPRRRHEQLMCDLAKRNPDAATRAMREHIENSMERAIRRLEPWFGLNHGHRFSRVSRPLQVIEPVA
jgi:DNA-binding GntR family transcriptional regulator